MNRSRCDYDVCIVGLGPAGLGVALGLTIGQFRGRVLCVDAGRALAQRQCPLTSGGRCDGCSCCDIIAGFGGCTGLGGGKVSGMPAGRGLTRILGAAQAPALVAEARQLYGGYVVLDGRMTARDRVEAARQHFRALGFQLRYYDVHVYDRDSVVKGYASLEDDLCEAGMEIAYATEMTALQHESGRYRLHVRAGGPESTITARHVVLALGRHGRQQLRGIATSLGLQDESNRLELGVRLEFPTVAWPDIDRDHRDLKLTWGNARTFCLCKNGAVVPYRVSRVCVLDGHLMSPPTGFTNLGVLVRLEPREWDESTIAGLADGQEGKARVSAIHQNLASFLGDGAPEPCDEVGTCCTVAHVGKVGERFAPNLSRQIRDQVSQFARRLLPEHWWNKVSVAGPCLEYGGVHVKVDRSFCALPGLYVVGDSVGDFRGLLQAFCSGLVGGRAIAHG